MKYEESHETPKLEAEHHSKSFLRKAASMKKPGKKSNPFGKRPETSVASPAKNPFAKKGR